MPALVSTGGRAPLNNVHPPTVQPSRNSRSDSSSTPDVQERKSNKRQSTNKRPLSAAKAPLESSSDDITVRDRRERKKRRKNQRQNTARATKRQSERRVILASKSSSSDSGEVSIRRQPTVTGYGHSHDGGYDNDHGFHNSRDDNNNSDSTAPEYHTGDSASDIDFDHPEPVLPWNERLEDLLQKALFHLEHIPSSPCTLCLHPLPGDGTREVAAEVYCLKCEAHFCKTCDHLVHRGALGTHPRWGNHVSVEPTPGLDYRYNYNPNCSCELTYPHQGHVDSGLCFCETRCEGTNHFLDVISQLSISTVCVRVCCSSTLPVQLLACGLFPCSETAPRVAVRLELLDLCDALQVDGALTMHRIASVLKHMHGRIVHQSLQHLRLLNLKALLQQTIYRYRALLVSVGQNTGDVHQYSDCPACSVHMTAIMIDAQFAIKNTKKRSERRREIAMHDGQRGVMLPRILVDAFVSAYTPGKSEKTRCSDFHAVDDAHKSHGSQFLDTTAVLTAVCRHDICAAIAQLRHGERYAYALIMLLHVCHLWPATATEKDAKLAAVLVREGKAALVQHNVDTKRAYSGRTLLRVRDGWLYDIECLFRPFAVNRRNALVRSDPESPLIPAITKLLNMKSGVGIGHVLGHQILCHLTKSARTIVGFGTTDGENCERFQSYLVYFKNQLVLQRLVHLTSSASKIIAKYL